MSLLIDSQPGDVRKLTGSERDALIVSAICVDGTWQVLSRYGDSIWEIRGATTNRAKSTNRHDFSKVPQEFREQLKAILYRYLRRGRFGEKKAGARQFRQLFVLALDFLRFVRKRGVVRLSAVTPMVCSMYVHECRTRISRFGRVLAPVSINMMLLAVEALYDLSQYTFDPMPSFPWPGESAWNLAGLTGKKQGKRLQGGRTPLIPDAEFTALFQAAWNQVLEANKLLDLRDELQLVDAEAPSSNRQASWVARSLLLKQKGWDKGLAQLSAQITDIRTACYIVVASLSGCRNHELAFVQSNACYQTVDDDGEVYWWMRSRSTKTGEGETEWMVPEAAVTALKVMDRWAAPYQAELLSEIERRRVENPADSEIAVAQTHVGAVFVGRDPKKGPAQSFQVRTLSNTTCNTALKAFAKKHGVAWNFATHQFRRKFANYAARSQFGDLRYLKEHFKHWSFDMTLGYAMNELQEIALYSEVYDELSDLKEGVVGEWMEPGVPLAGGLGERVIAWRGSHDITLFKDHKSMVRTLAEGFGNLRSNGHAWCTADQGIDCVGNGGLERTRCTGCDHAVIGRIHARIYQGLYDQLSQTLLCKDIGEGGRAYVQRSLDRCASVLASLGHDLQPRQEG